MLKRFGYVRGAVSTGHGGALLRPKAARAEELGKENLLWVWKGSEMQVAVQWMFSGDAEVLERLAVAVEEDGGWEVVEAGC